MRIVVVGAGKLGYSIAELLSNEQFEDLIVKRLGHFVTIHKGKL